MIVVHGENYELKRIPRKADSPYEWESTPDVIFMGRPAESIEVRNYRIQQGVNGNTDSVFVISSNLPSSIQIGDKIVFLGKEWSVQSVGYYFSQNRIANARLFSEEYLIERCPKGLNLQ